MTRALTLHAPAAPRRLPAWLAGETGRLVGGALDGLVVGLVVGYVALTAMGAPAAYLGIPWPLAIIVVGDLVLLAALLGAAAAALLVGIVGWVGRRIAASRWIGRHPRVGRVVAIPFGVVAALPAPWLGALAVLLWIALAGRTIAPLGLLTPPGILSPYVYLAAVVGAGLGAAAAVGAPGRIDRPGPVRRLVGGLLALAAIAILVGAVGLAVSPGRSDDLVAYDPAFEGIAVGPSGLDDPGATGRYEIETLSYGSGTDDRRPAFGAEADLLTPTVDAAAQLPQLDGGADAVRSWFWGFGTDRLPLDGLAWLPRGDGPFPLVLIVHGNHAMGDFSESGYAYLGEHLASRGFIAVSVDEDFLNGSWAGDWEGREQLVRAWLLLLHLDQWRTWNGDATSPLHGRVDLDRVALIGHSRGGEAASVAAMLAPRPSAPQPGMTPWPAGLDVDAVVSIAPSDGQYATTVVLEDVDFLTLAGGHDADARAWSGIRQFGRTKLDPDGFKAGLWSYRSNHGQFNTVWGRGDHGPFSGAALDLAPILPPEQQQDLARTAIGAFLEVSLHDDDAYRGFFRRPMIGREWLPEDIVLVRSVDGDDVPIALVPPDPPEAGPVASTSGRMTAASRSVPLRAIQPDQGARGLLLRWPAGDPEAAWTVDGLADAVLASLGPITSLRLALADGRDASTGSTSPLALKVEATTTDGVTVRLPLARYGAPPPPLPVRLAKHDLLMTATGIDLTLSPSTERVLQTYEVPLADFSAADPAFDPERLDRIAIRPAGGAEAGSLWLADVALGR